MDDNGKNRMDNEIVTTDVKDVTMEQSPRKSPDGKESSDEIPDGKESSDEIPDGNKIEDSEGVDDTSVENTEALQQKGEPLNFKMVWNKKNYEVNVLGTLNSVGSMRKHIEELTGIPCKMQKIMYKGLVKDDDATLQDVKINNNAKVMVVGSTLKDVEKVKTPTVQELKQEQAAEAAAAKEPLCKQKIHKKVIDKGKPDDAPPGLRDVKESLPPFPLSGMTNKTGGKVRLTFKLELDQLWLGTKERTEKLPMSSIRNVVSEAIEGHEEYHILAIQLGPTEASRYWIYWFPAQYVDCVKNTILGKWQAF